MSLPRVSFTTYISLYAHCRIRTESWLTSNGACNLNASFTDCSCSSCELNIESTWKVFICDCLVVSTANGIGTLFFQTENQRNLAAFLHIWQLCFHEIFKFNLYTSMQTAQFVLFFLLSMESTPPSCIIKHLMELLTQLNYKFTNDCSFISAFICKIDVLTGLLSMGLVNRYLMCIFSVKSSVSSLLTILWQYQVSRCNMGNCTASGMAVCDHAAGTSAIL